MCSDRWLDLVDSRYDPCHHLLHFYLSHVLGQGIQRGRIRIRLEVPKTKKTLSYRLNSDQPDLVLHDRKGAIMIKSTAFITYKQHSLEGRRIPTQLSNE